MNSEASIKAKTSRGVRGLGIVFAGGFFEDGDLWSAETFKTEMRWLL